MKYKTESRNTTEFINLHDCECLSLSYENSGIIMEMEWIEVLGEHPENPYNMAYSSDSGMIGFNDVIIIDGKIDYGNNCVKIIETGRHFKLEDITLYSYFEDSKMDLVYKYAEISGFTPDNQFIDMEFLFKESYIRWNKLEDVSWFESKERLESEKSEKEIIKMLSSNNPEEVQKKGLELASGIKYPGNFFQPFIDGESKSLWNNCALILSVKTDEELKHWLLQCFKWLQDMDCPGSEIIAERLRKYSDTESFERERKKAVRIARILDDKEWLESLNQVGQI